MLHSAAGSWVIRSSCRSWVIRSSLIPYTQWEAKGNFLIGFWPSGLLGGVLQPPSPASGMQGSVGELSLPAVCRGLEVPSRAMLWPHPNPAPGLAQGGGKQRAEDAPPCPLPGNLVWLRFKVLSKRRPSGFRPITCCQMGLGPRVNPVSESRVTSRLGSAGAARDAPEQNGLWRGVWAERGSAEGQR